jgi:hypothetical protein
LQRYPEQIPLLKEMGLRSAFFGIESLNWESAKAIGKGLHPDKIKETLFDVRKIWQEDVSVYSSFICGLPHETPDTFNEWTQWIIDKAPIDSWSCAPLFLYPSDYDGNWTSEFAKNPKEHGYDVTWSEKYNSWVWKNQYWDTKSAFIASKEFAVKGDNANKRLVSNIDLLGIMNYGYSFYDIRNKKFSELDQDEIRKRYLEQFNTYRHALYSFEHKH